MNDPENSEKKATLQTIEQQRAAFALNFITNLKSNKIEVLSCINALPAMIHMSGLGQAMALYKSKSTNAHIEIYKILSEWLCKKRKLFRGETDLLDGITKNDMNAYKMAQSEAQAFLIWLKNFAKAYLK